MTDVALPPVWQHDAYMLRPLLRFVRDIAGHYAKPGMVVVDLGAGVAPYRSLFTSRGARYVCADLPGEPSEAVIEPGVPMPFADKSVDIVVSFQVLEHVWDIGWYLAEARRILKDDGHLVLSTHGVWLYHPHPTDYRRWTCEGLKMEVQTRGYALERFDGMVGPFAWTVLFNELALYTLLKHVPYVGLSVSRALAALAYGLMALGDFITPRALARNNAANYILVAKKSPSSFQRTLE